MISPFSTSCRLALIKAIDSSGVILAVCKVIATGRGANEGQTRGKRKGDMM